MFILVPCFTNISVFGETLKNTLSSGVREKMEKAMMLLIKKASSGSIDQAKAGPSRPKHSVSIEMLDEHGEKVIKEPVKNVVDVSGDVGRRKRPRAEDQQPRGLALRRVEENAVASGVNKTLTIIGNRAIMNPPFDVCVSKEVIGVEIRPSERWLGNSAVPL